MRSHLATGIDSAVPDPGELKTITSKEQVRKTIGQYVQQRPQLLDAFLPQLRALRETLQANEEFALHSFIRTSLLFVYSGVTNEAKLAMIDFPRCTERLPSKITHREAWAPGNHEDGYLVGVDNLIALFESVRESVSAC